MLFMNKQINLYPMDKEISKTVSYIKCETAYFSCLTTKKLLDDEMSAVQLQITDHVAPKKVEEKKEFTEDDYLVKQLERRP